MGILLGDGLVSCAVHLLQPTPGRYKTLENPLLQIYCIHTTISLGIGFIVSLSFKLWNLNYVPAAPSQ